MLNLDRIAAENLRLPRNADGHIVSPRYVHVGSPYRSVWREWCKKNPESDWPDWLKKDINQMRHKRKPVRGEAEVSPSAPRK